MNIFGLKINFMDFFAQVGHALTIVMGVLTGVGILDPKQVQTVQDAGTAVINGVSLLTGGASTAIHAMGWTGVVIGLVNWILHNTDVVNSLIGKPAAAPAAAATSSPAPPASI
ncbi:MAG TPA: hypothetical protein VJ873_09415 [bacterium]|nr:hypothetical protein [bacterium]